MMFLKISKNIFLLFILLLFIVSGVLLQTSLILKNSLFSESYFDKSFDKNQMIDNIVKLSKDAMDNVEKLYSISDGGKKEDIKNNSAEIPPDAQKLIDAYKKMLKENIDMQWIQVEIPNTIKGLYGYFLSERTKLPVININPVKEAYVSMFVQSIIEHSDSNATRQVSQTAVAIKDILTKYSNDKIINDQVIDEMMKLKQFKAMNMSREAVGRFAQTIAGLNNIKPEELLKYSVTEMIKDRISFYEIKDDLDLNLLFETKYGNKNNPVSGIAGLVKSIKNSVFWLIFALFTLLLLIIVLTVFTLKGILRWSGIGIFLSGIICMVAYRFTGLVDSKIMANFKELNEKAKGLDILFLQKWILSFIDGVWKYIFVSALIFIVIGIILFTASFFVHHIFKKTTGDSGILSSPSISKQKNNFLMLVRIISTLILLITIPVYTAININQIRISVEQYNKMKENAIKTTKDTNEVLGIVLNAQKLMEMMKDEKTVTQ